MDKQASHTRCVTASHCNENYLLHTEQRTFKQIFTLSAVLIVSLYECCTKPYTDTDYLGLYQQITFRFYIHIIVTLYTLCFVKVFIKVLLID